MLDASHRSLARDYEVSCAELDLACEARALGRCARGADDRRRVRRIGDRARAVQRADDVTDAVGNAFAAQGLRAPEIREATPSAGATRL